MNRRGLLKSLAGLVAATPVITRAKNEIVELRVEGSTENVTGTLGESSIPDITHVMEIRTGVKPRMGEPKTGEVLCVHDLRLEQERPELGKWSNLSLAEPCYSVAIRSGTATWCSVRAVDGDEIYRGSIGTSYADLNLSSTNITTGATQILLNLRLEYA